MPPVPTLLWPAGPGRCVRPESHTAASTSNLALWNYCWDCFDMDRCFIMAKPSLWYETNIHRRLLPNKLYFRLLFTGCQWSCRRRNREGMKINSSDFGWIRHNHLDISRSNHNHEFIQQLKVQAWSWLLYLLDADRTYPLAQLSGWSLWTRQSLDDSEQGGQRNPFHLPWYFIRENWNESHGTESQNGHPL